MTEKEEKIIQVDLRLFAKNGFASTTIQEIANECDISKGAFYLHFKSKDALLLAIIKYYIDRTTENMKAIQQKISSRRRFSKNRLLINLKKAGSTEISSL
ncbi:TetR/AcrR family transcriptional regulator [Bacillus sonorensis]|nr:TetR/AcrR family transcriptional regulator [Bacillus sonorensis]